MKKEITKSFTSLLHSPLMQSLVRVSLGTLAVLGMEMLFIDDYPTTAYLQIYSAERCKANCLFCSQAKNSLGKMQSIAYGQYVPREINEVVRRLSIAYQRKYFKRACIQTILRKSMWNDLLQLINEIRKKSEIPISVSVYPLTEKKLQKLKSLGVDKLVIPIDACNKKIFDKIKGKNANSPYSWKRHLNGIKNAVKIFGKENVGTHLILGLGEKEEDVVKLVSSLHEKGVYPSLFAYTPIKGAQFFKKKPNINYYRRMQLAVFLIKQGKTNYEKMMFKNKKVINFGVEKKEIENAINSGEPFLTSGCENCNRPYATELPKDVYNFPRKLKKEEIEKVREELKI